MAESSPRVSNAPSPPADVKSVAPSRLRAGGSDDPDARPARLQMIAALVIGLALVAVPLYVWRRPIAARAEKDAAELAASAAAAASAAPIAPGSQTLVSPGNPLVGPPSAAITLSESRILECHDAGPKKTPAEQCDHLAPIEQAFAKAVTEAASCVPTSAGGGSLVFLADVSFGRKRNPVLVTLPRDGRSLGASLAGVSSRGRASRDASSAKVVAACAAAVKRTLTSAVGESLATAPHAHTRYKIAITASYPTPPPAAAPASPYP